MRYRLSSLCLITIFVYGFAFTGTAQEDVSIDSLITPASLKQLVQVLAADSFQGRLTGSPQAAKAALFIGEEFKKAGTLPLAGNDGYIMRYLALDKITAFNVIAALPGKSKAQELIIFSAHYDHIGTIGHAPPGQPSDRGRHRKDDNVYNGANDNASGISGLLHLARYYAKQPNRERTIIFIAFSGEEEGLLGSKKLAASFDPKVIKAMINMDMIGRPISPTRKFPIITGEEQSNLQELLNKKLAEKTPLYDKNYFRGDWFTWEKLYTRSDNYPFAQRGVIAHTIMASSPRDEYYHSLGDEWETLDYDFMAEVVKAIALASTGLVDGTDTPKQQ